MLFEEAHLYPTVNHEIKQGLEIAFANCDEVDVEHVPGIEHDWGGGWVNPFLILLGHMECLNSSLDEFSLMVNDHLMLIQHGYRLPVVLHLLELISLDKGSDLMSEGLEIWSAVENPYLHISQLVVLFIVFVPLIVVDVDDESLVWLLADHFGVSLGGSLELLLGHLDFLNLGFDASQFLFQLP